MFVCTFFFLFFFLQGTLRRVTFSVVSQPHDGGCYDSGLEDSETPSSKSSSGPRLGALPLPEEGYERTTPEGSVGEEEHVENGQFATESIIGGKRIHILYLSKQQEGSKVLKCTYVAENIIMVFMF